MEELMLFNILCVCWKSWSTMSLRIHAAQIPALWLFIENLSLVLGVHWIVGAGLFCCCRIAEVSWCGWGLRESNTLNVSGLSLCDALCSITLKGPWYLASVSLLLYQFVFIPSDWQWKFNCRAANCVKNANQKNWAKVLFLGGGVWFRAWSASAQRTSGP